MLLYDVSLSKVEVGNMSAPLVSVIVPAYNSEEYINECIQSVVNQTFTDWELIVVNDGSKDKTGEFAEQWKVRDSRIHVIHQKNGGVSKARNAGIDTARGTYITFLDSDDLMAPICLEALCNNITNADMCVYSRDILHAGDPIPSITEVTTATIYNLQEAYNMLQKGAVIINSPCSRLFSLNIIREKGIRFREDLKLAEDLFFNLEYLDNCHSIAIGKTITYYYRTDFSVLSRTVNLDYGRIQSDSYVAHKEFTKKHHIVKDFSSHRKRAVVDVVGAVIHSSYSMIERWQSLKDFSHTPLAVDFINKDKPKNLKELIVKIILFFL